MPLAVQPITPAVAAIAADLGVALQPGTVVNAQVMKVLEANLVRIAIGSLILDATTMSPLEQGQKLQLSVAQTAAGLTLTPVKGDAAALSSRAAPLVLDDVPLAPSATDEMLSTKPGLTPQETRAVAVAAQSAVTRQAGLSQLFANLSAAADAGGLPRDVALATTQLLDLRQTTRSITGDDIKAALKSSGLMFEAQATEPSSNAPPDLKSALLVLKQALSSWLAETDAAPMHAFAAKAPVSSAAATITDDAAPAAGTLRGQNNTSLSAAVQALIAESSTGAIASGNKNLLVMQLIASGSRGPANSPAEHAAANALPPPFRGGSPSSQPVAPPSLTPGAEPSDVARQLMADTDGALARQTLLQVASLPDRIDQQTLRSDPAQPRWNFEIPFVTPQGTAMAQFEIARDGGGQDHEAGKRFWRAHFTLTLEPAGPVHALITFGGDATHVKMWAERPATAAQLRANVGQLGQSFARADLKAGDILVADGAPPQARAPSAGHFLNRAT